VSPSLPLPGSASLRRNQRARPAFREQRNQAFRAEDFEQDVTKATENGNSIWICAFLSLLRCLLFKLGFVQLGRMLQPLIDAVLTVQALWFVAAALGLIVTPVKTALPLTAPGQESPSEAGH
jgi:hypothetical protein